LAQAAGRCRCPAGPPKRTIAARAGRQREPVGRAATEILGRAQTGPPPRGGAAYAQTRSARHSSSAGAAAAGQTPGNDGRRLDAATRPDSDPISQAPATSGIGPDRTARLSITRRRVQ
jgi:hypothetical protein